MNKKELIKLLDKYEIEYEITDNTKEVEEGLRLFDEALEKIGIIIPKETQVDTITRENDPEVPKYTTEWASSDDIISRYAAIEAMAPFDTNHELRDTLEGLPSERPKGEWEEVEDYNGDTHYQCNQCGDEFILIDGTPEDNKYWYCPNCGADMRCDKE